MIVSIGCAAARFAHADITRLDATLMRLFDWGKVARATKPSCGCFSALTKAVPRGCSPAATAGCLTSCIKSITLDVDCSVITRWGSQMQGAAKGYNPKNHGRVSHHPLLAFVVAFVADWPLVANFWLRPGNTHSLNNALGFLEETLSNHRHDCGRSVQGR